MSKIEVSKTSVIQKIGLFCLGVFLTFVLLEIGLRLAGMFVLYLQDRHNHQEHLKSSYRILCLGESTTALGGIDAYPSQLENILNQNQQRKFTVINKGVISVTTEYILDHLKENLQAYHPHMVVLMMGINDYAFPPVDKTPNPIRKIRSYITHLKTVKLVDLIIKHASSKWSGYKNMGQQQMVKDQTPIDKEKYMEGFIAAQYEIMKYHYSKAVEYQKNNNKEAADAELGFAQKNIGFISGGYIDLARRYISLQDLDKAKFYLNKASTFHFNELDLAMTWGEYYLASQEPVKAVGYYQKALILDASNAQALQGFTRAWYYHNKIEAIEIYFQYLQKQPNDYWACLELASWLKEIKDYDKAIDVLNKAISMDKELDKAYLDLAKIYELSNNKAKANEYFAKASNMVIKNFSDWTFTNYELIIDELIRQNITVVVMQYPNRDIGILKEKLSNKKGLIFVENRQNFKDALESKRYSDYFSDRFAYDFGHCTTKGNKLIAQNLAQHILDLIK